MHDAVDHNLIYEQITITRDLTTSSGLKLVKGTSYEAVWFNFVSSEFSFIDWAPPKPGSNGVWEPNPNTHIVIPQAELAPFLHWNDEP